MIRTYADLQSSVAAWLARGDLKDQIPEFIQLAEAEIARQLRRKTVRGTLSLAAESTPLPADCAELRSIVLNSGTPWLDLPLRLVTAERLAEVRAYNSATPDRPTYAVIVDGTLRVAPAPDAAYDADVTYFQRLVPLSATAQTNVVLTEAPDAYLFGTLLQASSFLDHDERVAGWRERFDRAVAQLNVAREREESAASLRPMRLPVVF